MALTHTRGPRCLLNPPLAEGIMKLLSSGTFITTACEYLGISNRTYHVWRDRGEMEIARVNALSATDEPLGDIIVAKASENKTYTEMIQKVPKPFHAKEWNYVAFATIAARSRIQAEVRALAAIQVAGNKDWKAYAWYLEHTRAADYGINRLQVSGTPGQPIEVTNASVEALTRKLDELTNGGQ